MALSYLKQTTFTIPTGYTITNGAMTADSLRVYFAASHATQPQMLIFDMDGDRQETAEFNIHALETDRSFDAVAIDAENLYLLSNSDAIGVLADVYPYSKLGTAGRRFALEGLTDDLDSVFEEVRGAIFLNAEIVVLMHRTVGDARLSIARFRPDGSYVQNSFSGLGLPSDADPRGMTLAGNQVFILDDDRLLALDRGFTYVPTEDVTVNSANTAPFSAGWNGNAALVYDDAGSVFFYGAEQIAVATSSARLRRQYRSRAFRKYEETLDIVKRNADGTLLKRGIGVKVLRYSTLQEVYVADSADLTTLVTLFTIIPQYPMPEIEADDFIFANMGATEDNPPTELPAEKYQVKAFGDWGGRYKQVLYCVRVRGDGEADALAGAHSPLRVRNRR